MKNIVGAFSTLKHEIRFTFAGMLDTRFETPESKFHEFLALYDSLELYCDASEFIDCH
ncbi:hypothetical protein ACIGEL_07825 [Rossellomorea aquimaris]|uniref:hypothetical protein n=1 Tax=Rossellomorea aquimaris TaxID=189382 RepID=UPI0037C53180